MNTYFTELNLDTFKLLANLKNTDFTDEEFKTQRAIVLNPLAHVKNRIQHLSLSIVGINA